MGTGPSKYPESSGGGGGGQLYVSLRAEGSAELEGGLVPHVYGSAPIVGAWDAARALAMERESATAWALSLVVPSDHDTLDFKFLLKPKNVSTPCLVEEGPNRLLTRGNLEGDARAAKFRLDGDKEMVVEYKISIKADVVSPFDLAASWKAYQAHMQTSKVQGAPDVSVIDKQNGGNENGFSANLEHDLVQYLVPSPASANSGVVYASNLAEDPRKFGHAGVFSKIDSFSSSSHGTTTSNSSRPVDHASTEKDIKVTGPDASKVIQYSGMVQSKSVGTFSPMQKQDGQGGPFVDRGVGSPRLVKSASLCSLSKRAMPAAAGAVEAAAIADQMLGQEEDKHLAIVLVGLPARGKTFTSAKLTRYLRWLGHDTKHFNVGKYRRLKHGANQLADFFRADNPEGIRARNEVAALAMDDMIAWMQEGGQVGIFDATNSTRERRKMLMKMAEGKCKIIFLESICNDPHIIERNIRLKIQQSPDYAEQPDFEAGLEDFKRRLANYEKAYEPVEEGSYIKMIDMASGHGGQIQVNNISGYLPGRIVCFLVNTHLTPRPVFLTCHGESQDNVRGRIGGDLDLSEAGEVFTNKLTDFVQKRLKSERAASIWTSTLKRTIMTASPIVGFPKVQWRALDDINVGICDRMTMEEIRRNMPEEFESWENDKLRYRYPRGESYLDVIQRLEPVIIELERQRAPVVLISHQAVLRSLYAYFADRPLEEVPNIEVPLHTVIEIQMGVTGVQEKRYNLL